MEGKTNYAESSGSADDVAMSTGADVTETRPYGTQKGMCIFYITRIADSL